MASQKFENVWDALEDTPADAASMTLRSSLLIAIDLRVRGWKITQVEAARRLGADLLIMGAYPHHPIAELILGGVTRYLVSHADLPILMRH